MNLKFMEVRHRWNLPSSSDLYLIIKAYHAYDRLYRRRMSDIRKSDLLCHSQIPVFFFLLIVVFYTLLSLVILMTDWF